ncbi:hypothetical protein GOBAR_AA22663 [Gossypium barbadense]|uniref:Uncharacterized protein n=1 Tax=Gossypium barbadense TaxID=3634 RepID=A0A2P5X3T4_GOSBA|nr:hypothetical protein GOBAR_AA22663 [Gossypium barbadense]
MARAASLLLLMELCIMLLECCSQERTYLQYYGLLGLGGITENLREYLKNMPRLIMRQQKPASESESSDESGSLSLSASKSANSESDSSSSVEHEKRSKKRRRR